MPLPGQMVNTRAGSPNTIFTAIEQKIRYVIDPRTGGQTIRTFHGSGAACNALIPVLQSYGWACDLHGRSAGPEFELVATIGLIWANSLITDNPFSTWELTSNKSEVPILKAQNALVASLSQADQQTLSGYISNPPAPTTFAQLITQAPYSSLSTNGQTLLADIMAGVDALKIFYPVLTQNQVTSNIYAIAASFQNVGCIISTSELAAILPAALAFSMPSDPAYGLTGFQYGWLKNYPNVTVAPYNKTNIRQEYEFGLWPTSLYTFV